MKIEAWAPSNIALIKYMGKTGTNTNLPTNASLSLTLEHLRTFVTLEPAERDHWLPLEGLPPLALSEAGQMKFLNHLARLKAHWGLSGHYLVRSGNNFPSDCGLASSASSFAALTLAASKLTEREVSVAELSRLSRLGSGSSCRSFFSPWALWRSEGAEDVDIDWKLEHAVVIVHSEKKAVSSSQAHGRVTGSLLFAGRTERAETRLTELTAALQARDWSACFELCWAEFWDMHALFETSRPSFGYMSDESLRVLGRLRHVWAETGDGPLVTMDAGANIHLLLRPEQTRAAEGWLTGLNTLKSWS